MANNDAVPTLSPEYISSFGSAPAQVAAPVEASIAPVEAPLAPVVDAVDNLSPDYIENFAANVESHQKYGDSPFTASALAGLDAASFSLSSRVLKGLGITSEKDLQEYQRQNPGADIAGTMLGVAIPAVLSGGSSLAAKVVAAPVGAAIKTGAAVERAVAKTLANSVAQSASKKIAGEVVKKSLAANMAAKGAAGVTEGAIFGAGNMLREDALGTAELNAENLAAHVGTGALYGGLLTGAMPVIGKAATIGSQSGKQIFDKAAKRWANPRDAALEYVGATPAQRAKLMAHSSGQDIVENLPKILVEDGKINATNSSREVLENLNTAQGLANSEIDSIIGQIDDAMEDAATGTFQQAKDAFYPIAQTINRDFIAHYAGKGPAFNPIVSKARNIVKSLVTMSGQPEYVATQKLANKIANLTEDIKSLKNAVRKENAASGKLIAEAGPKRLQSLNNDLTLAQTELAEHVKSLAKRNTDRGMAWDAASGVETKARQAIESKIAKITAAIEGESIPHNQVPANMFFSKMQLDPSKLSRAATSNESKLAQMQAELQASTNRHAQLMKDPVWAKKVGATELRVLKQDFDKLAKSFYDNMKPSEASKAAYQVRTMLNDTLKGLASRLSPEIAAALEAANSKSHQLIEIIEIMSKKAEKPIYHASAADMLLGIGGVAWQGPVGALGWAGKKFFESDLKRKLVILSGIEKANQNVASKISAATESFFKNAAKPLKLSSMTALVNTNLAVDRETNERAKTEKQAFKNITKNLSNLVTNTDELLDRTVKAGAPISVAAPETAKIMGEKLVQMVQFLHDKLPKRPYEAASVFGKEKPYEPSSIEVAKFQRYLQVAENPMSVFDELATGNLTREHVEALKALYPDMYVRLQQEVLKFARAADEADISYQKRLQMGILLDIPTDASLTGQNIMGLQQNFDPQLQAQEGAAVGAPPVTTSVPRADKVNMAERAETDNQALARRSQSQ